MAFERGSGPQLFFIFFFFFFFSLLFISGACQLFSSAAYGTKHSAVTRVFPAKHPCFLAQLGSLSPPPLVGVADGCVNRGPPSQRKEITENRHCLMTVPKCTHTHTHTRSKTRLGFFTFLCSAPRQTSRSAIWRCQENK